MKVEKKVLYTDIKSKEFVVTEFLNKYPNPADYHDGFVVNSNVFIN